MSLFDGLEKLINERASAAVMGQWLAFAKDQYADLESKTEALRTEKAELIAQADLKQTLEELRRLREQHVEEVRIHSAIEFRRGQRTGGKWLPFCPVCHMPIGWVNEMARCSNHKCDWEIEFHKRNLLGVVSLL